MLCKTFKSRLFNKTITCGSTDYWYFLYAEVLFRLKALEDLKCPCGFCFQEKIKLNHIIDSMINDGHIKENQKPNNFTHVGDCGRRLGPVV